MSTVRDGFTGLRRALGAGGLLTALCLAAAPTAAQIQVVSAPAEYERLHPKPVAKAEAHGVDFKATMDQVFGAGRWRKTSGYRTLAQENALRREGAGTVAPGHISRHSIGGAEAPGAYDAVVDRMPLASAAAKLRQAGAPFARVAPERAHGRQGPHLHIELANEAAPSAGPEADNPRPRRGRPT